jgi:trigger factor
LKVDIESPAEWSRRLKITVPAEQVARERQVVLRKIAKRVKLPGFRKGKVPASRLEKQFGASIEQETVERVVNSAYRAALAEQGSRPSPRPRWTTSYEPGADLSFDVEFEVRPEVELARLGGFTIQAPPAAVAEADVDRVMDRLREQNAAWHPVDGAAGRGRSGARGDHAPGQPGRGCGAAGVRGGAGRGEILESIDQAIRTLEPGSEGEFTVDLPGDDGEQVAQDPPQAPGLGAAGAAGGGRRVRPGLGDFDRWRRCGPDPG